MTISKRVIKALLILFGLCIIVVSLPWSCGICDEDRISEAHSPDGKYLARAYIRDCGATTGFLTHVNLRSGWGWFNPDWVGTVKNGQVFANSCWSKVSFIWKDNSNLEIQYEQCAPDERGNPAWLKEEYWKGVKIWYREVPRPTDR
jgi:hypothetical protein